MTRYINSSKYWNEYCKNKSAQLFLTVPTSLALLGLMVNVERVSAILSLRGADSKSTSLKYCRLTCNWADGATHRSYPHMVLQIPCRQGLKVLHLLPRAPCRSMVISLRGLLQHAT